MRKIHISMGTLRRTRSRGQERSSIGMTGAAINRDLASRASALRHERSLVYAAVDVHQKKNHLFHMDPLCLFARWTGRFTC